MSNIKKCNKCGQELPVSRFRKRIYSSGNIGYQPRCSDCERAAAAEWRKNNPEKAKAAAEKYRKNNPEKITERIKKWQRNNPDKCRESYAKWRKHNLRHRAKYARKCRGNNLTLKISNNIRSAITRALDDNVKACHMEELLGCSIESLRKHLERLFQPDMTWDNYGRYGWHIDHIIPLSYFDFTDLEQQRRAWHYTNLQPLWAAENLKKSNKIIETQLKLL